MMIKGLCSAAVVLLLTTSIAGAHDTRSTGEISKVTLVYEHELRNVPG